ncbi:recombinase family protein [Paracoccus tegillarcae]|uniref:Recombinase family protein n=1 Tax=Paracoccus tegillarcae TaxID=1529068 RepID=A0A2K9F2S3_9RHOB|nr:recombinase family protein [Paracoccus tegillarcae]AUH34662.1 recombinase family protein [Paracoccus tegillarcae]
MNNDYFGYVRVSTQKQGEGASLEAQRDAITRYGAQNGLIITEWFCEKETAAKAGRPVFAAMVRDLKKRRAAGFIVHKIDRSARNFKDWAMIGDLSDAGFDIHFATETLDFRSRGGRLAADIQAVIAADYIRNLREETKKGMKGRLKQGLYPFKAPLGYRDNGGGKVKTICPRKGPLVRELFIAYASGEHSLPSLQAYATELGLATQYGSPLSVGFLGGLLSNPFYCGIIKIKKTGDTYPGQHDALVTVATFKRVQAVKLGKHVKRVTRHRHRYRGLFVCAHCSYAMIAERQGKHVYYRCHTSTCPRNSIREDAIDRFVFDHIRQLRLTEEAQSRLMQEARKWQEPDLQDGAITLSASRQLHQLKENEQTLNEALLSKVVDAETYKQQKERIALERRRFEDCIAKGSENDQSAKTVQIFLELAKTVAGLYETMTCDEKREFLEIATSNRIIKDKNAQLEPRNWLRWVKSDPAFLNGTPARPNSRRPHDPAYHIEQVMEAMQCDEAKRFIALCQKMQDRNAAKENPPAKADRFRRAG